MAPDLVLDEKEFLDHYPRSVWAGRVSFGGDYYWDGSGVDFFKDSGDVDGDSEYAGIHLYCAGFAGVPVIAVHDLES